MPDENFPPLLDSLLALSNEKEWIEFKHNNANPDKIGQYISALSNSAVLHKKDKAYLIWGIEDGTKNVVGTIFQPEVTRVGNQILSMWLSQQLRPRPHFEFICADYQSKPIVLLSITPVKEQPVKFKDHAYIRVGESLNPLDEHAGKLREFWDQAVTGDNRGWDCRLEETATYDNLDPTLIAKFLERLDRGGRIDVPANMEPVLVLEKLQLLKDGQPSRAAVLLLTKDPSRFYPSAYIKAGRFKSPTDIVDDKEFHGSLFEQLDAAMQWLQEKMSRKFIIGKSTLSGKDRLSGNFMERDEEWDYPLASLREAMANAICHRDYMINTAVSIRFFDDRLEIWNPGKLPSDLPPEGLFKTHESRAPNQLIATSFFNTKIIERWGTGTIRMAEALETHKQPPPVFDTSSTNNFKVMMFASGYSDADLQKMKLSDRQIRAIRYLQLHKTITNTEYQDLFEASKPTASRDLSQLAKLNLLNKVGTTGKGTGYVLVDRKGLE